jgi:hypothetical protein
MCNNYIIYIVSLKQQNYKHMACMWKVYVKYEASSQSATFEATVQPL